MTGLLLIPVMAVLFYFMLIRPQQKRMRQQASTIAAISTGDEIVTIGGIYATITRVLDDRFEVEVADGTRFYILKSAIGRRISNEPEREIVSGDIDDEGIE